MNSKICKKCSKTKLVIEFYAHPQTSDGFDNKCKECAKAIILKNRHAKIEKYRAYDIERAKTPERKAHIARVQRNWRKKYPDKAKAQLNRHPERRAARIAVGNAVRDKKLLKQPCETCGTTEQIQAHHDDYSKPLDVRWFCRKHHKEQDQNKGGRPRSIGVDKE